MRSAGSPIWFRQIAYASSSPCRTVAHSLLSGKPNPPSASDLVSSYQA
jgi:hypothetical protein